MILLICSSVYRLGVTLKSVLHFLDFGFSLLSGSAFDGKEMRTVFESDRRFINKGGRENEGLPKAFFIHC